MFSHRVNQGQGGREGGREEEEEEEEEVAVSTSLTHSHSCNEYGEME